MARKSNICISLFVLALPGTAAISAGSAWAIDSSAPGSQISPAPLSGASHSNPTAVLSPSKSPDKLSADGETNTGNKFSLPQALELAYSANPTLAAAIAQRAVSQGEIAQAKIRINPTYQTELAPAEITYRFAVFTTTTQLGFKRQRRIEVARRLIDSTNATIRTMAWKTRQDTESAYFEVAAARQTLAAMEDYVATTRRLLAISKKRYEVRDASGLDVLRAEAAVADAKAQLAPVQVRVEQAGRQLNLVMGQPPEQTVDIEPPEFLLLGKLSARIPTYASLVEESQNSRPEFRQNEADMAVQKARIKMANSFWWPDIQSSIGMSSVSQLTAAQSNSWFGSHLLNKPVWLFTVPLTINDHGQGMLAIAKASLRQLEQQRLALTNQVRQEINLAYSNSLAAENQMYILFSESLPRQAKIVTMSETGYRQGALDLTTAITAQQTALAARLNFLQTATRYFQSLVELERSVGRPIITEMVSTTKEQQK